jgi:hypothetical protein
MNQKKFFFFITLILIICITESGCILSRYSAASIPDSETSISPDNPARSPTTGIASSSVPAEEQKRAEEVIHRFIRSDNTSLIFEKSENFGYGDLLTFTGDTGMYVVNNNTGRVQSAQLNYSRSSEGLVISQQDAILIAESYAKEKYPQLWDVSPIRSVNVTYQEMIDHGTMGMDYSFVWRDIWYNPRADVLNHYTITGPDEAQVSVDTQGHVTRYSEVYYPDSPRVNLTPALTEEQAWEIATAYYEKRGVFGILPTEKTASGLWIYDDASNDIGWHKYGKHYLAWVFYVRHQGDRRLMGGQIFIDANDGHIINYGEIL